MKKLSSTLRHALAAACCSVVAAAHASPVSSDTTILGANFVNGTSSYTEGLDPLGASATFTAGPSGRTFQKKTQYGYTGVGVSGGRTGDEIDIGESISASFTRALQLQRFGVNVLFDGPEYGDWNEVAQIRATLADGGYLFGLLQVTSESSASWWVDGVAMLGSSVSPLAGALARDGYGGAWEVSNPFGDFNITGLEFTALQSTVCSSGSCSNQSDYALHSLQLADAVQNTRRTNVVPEPGSAILVGLALATLVFTSRRRRQRADR